MERQFRLQQLQSAREQTVSKVGRLLQSQIEYSPAPDRWSVGEVLDHLVLMEDYFRGIVVRLIDRARVGERPLVRITFADFNPAPRPLPKSWLPPLEVPFSVLSSLVPHRAKAAFARHRIVRMQAPDIGLPSSGAVASELIDRLLIAMKETEAVFALDPSLEYRRLIVRHPFSGSTNAVQLLEILTLHELRHQKQIRDILSSAGFPW